MQVLRSGWQLPSTRMRPASTSMPEGRSAAELARETRRSESIVSRAEMPSTDMSFAVVPGSNSIIVTLADRTSGEIFRKLVYDRSGALRSLPQAGTGGLLDIAA